MTIYLNGEFMPIAEAKISVLDRGFIFGDGVYEVIPVYSRKAFRLAEHLRRLQHSLDGIKLVNPHSASEWVIIIKELIARNSGEDQYLYLHITRGVAKRDHAFPNPPVKPTVFMMSNPLSAPPAALLKSGVCAVTAQDNRWLRCDIKAIALLPNVLLRQMAVDAGCAETILIRAESMNEGAFLTEGAASNIFVVKNGKLLAPPKDNLMLPGITYDVILEIAAENGIPHEVRRIDVAEVFAADELLLTSSTKEVLAITQLDGKPVGTGKP
ncbi:MAG TPA: D-amino acid aminotransferase, partial [Gallionella sp.]